MGPDEPQKTHGKFFHSNGKKLCPLVQETLECCYCSNLQSQNVSRAMRFCAGEYEECEVYKRIQSAFSPK
jgi:hypothetical protein